MASMDNWTWGLSLIALTIAIHVLGIVAMGLVLHPIWVRVSSRRLALRHVFAILVGLIGTVGLILAVLHGIEAGLWAAAYWRLGAFVSPDAAMLYSIDSITTRGASGLTLPAHWGTLGALEAVDGMLLFGISTAFIFAVMQTYWPILTTRRS
jgi:hypothetical protein